MQMKQLTRDQVIEILRKRQGEKQGQQFAKEIGVSPTYITNLYKGKVDPGPPVLKFLNLKVVRVYVAA